ncbi:glutathione S-transferase family protein [Croceibacterium sp. LX-88]|uniref:Glutathione S-transferase family protein n=1 Tax=Croceibacterium selenioxidans TaxID=2838833 RepID=A0ABS5W4R7_9SPHN|nr:glutathione S-transferase family protein [Croceibacterium selenioxidans]MBT2134317.1 glutathione S-transferase family protein [Croceibacterium selenioxidans]
MTPSAPRPLVTAFEWVPPFARGLVRDLRVRWALEEIGEPYDTELLNAGSPRPEAYLSRQPFDQVPAFREGDLDIFETGAILLYLGEQDERLLPKDGQPRWTAISWLFSALNSVEPFIVPITIYDLLHQDKAWMPEAREAALAICRKRLSRLTDALAGKDWLAGRFSIADIAMITVLNNLRHTDLIAEYPALAAYKARGEERPAYKRALAAQMADFTEEAA